MAASKKVLTLFYEIYHVIQHIELLGGEQTKKDPVFHVDKIPISDKVGVGKRSQRSDLGPIRNGQNA